MFEQIKKLQELKKMQDSFKKEKTVVERNGISVVMNGNFEIEDIKLNPEIVVEEQGEILKQCINEAKEKIQKNLASKMMASGFGL